MKKIILFILSIVLIVGIILSTFSVALSISAEEAYTGVIDNGGSEEMPYPFVDGGYTATNTHNTDEVHSGNYSTKIVTSIAGMNASFKIESTTNYSKIPLNKEVHITFWAKADETSGFRGSIFTGNVYQTGTNGTSNKLDDYILTFAAGTASTENGWVEFDKEWKQYFIKVQKPFADGYTGCYSFINLRGKGTLYIDDFDITVLNSQSGDIIDNASSELMAYEAYGNAGNPAEHSSDEAHSGSFSTKISKNGSIRITSSTNYNKIPLNKEVYISFWAKADKSVGYKGTIYTGNVYQTGANGASNKLDNYMLTFAAGSAITEDGWVEFGKEWKQYFIKVQKPFADGYNGMYSFINFDGKGVLYLDDFDIIDLNTQIEDTNIIDNAGSEIKAFGDTGTPTEHTSDEAHSGDYSTKISKNGSIKITSSTNYNKIPLNKEVYISFWAKADKSVGYKGAIYTGNVYQTASNGSSNKLDNNMLTFAAGTAVSEDGWVEFDKDWKQYLIKVAKPFVDGYNGMYSFINFDGKGVLYLDDFDIVDLNAQIEDTNIIDNAGSELKVYEAYNNSAEQTSDEAHSGNYSTKIFKNGSIRITSTTNYDKIPLGQDVFITFYAKADKKVGFKGAMGSSNIYQVADDGTTLKLDGWTMAYAFGNTISEEQTNLWEEVPTEWTKYYIKVLHDFDIGYTSMYSFINFVGEGILYIDDFNIETAGEGSGSENPLKVEISNDVNGARYYESTADGTFQIEQKVVIKNLTSSFESGICEYIVTDSTGDEISSGDFNIAIGPQSTSTYAVDCSSVAAYGTYTVDFSVTRTDGSQYYVGKINLSRIKRVEKINSDDIFGINFHYGEVSNDKKDELRELLKPIAAMGVNTIRTSFLWTDYETKKGVYNFTQNLKNYFEVCAEFNIVVAPVLKESGVFAVGNPLYANGDLSADESVEGYGNFCAAFIEYLGDYAKYA